MDQQRYLELYSKQESNSGKFLRLILIFDAKLFNCLNAHGLSRDLIPKINIVTAVLQSSTRKLIHLAYTYTLKYSHCIGVGVATNAEPNFPVYSHAVDAD